MTTIIDTQKKEAQMLIEYANGGSFTVNMKGEKISGRGVKTDYGNSLYEVTQNKLDALKKSFTWMPNF